MRSKYGFEINDLIEQDKTKWAKHVRYQPLLNGQFEVKSINEEWVWINHNGTVKPFSGYWFKVVKKFKEDKMENRIVRKLEDLDGLENGFGARIQRIEKSIYMQVLTNDKSLYDFNISEVSGERYFNDVIGVLKAMGFKFEYKPLRTVDEVLEEMRANSLNPYCEYKHFLFEVLYDKFRKEYEVNNTDSCFTLGAYIFNQETAQKYADELNEIVRCK